MRRVISKTEQAQLERIRSRGRAAVEKLADLEEQAAELLKVKPEDERSQDVLADLVWNHQPVADTLELLGVRVREGVR